jgi:Ca2+-binding RTX toxin-like protein
MGGTTVHAIAGLLVASLAFTQTQSASDDRTDSGVSSTADTCFGQQPTIIGTRGQELVGTEGPDVVVTNGAQVITASAGDDLLCVTGGTTEADIRDAGCVMLDAGEGDDRIDATGGDVPCSLTIIPGLGSDEVLAARPGGAGVPPLGVSVDAHAWIDGDEVAADADVIRTGDGPDSVAAGVQDVVDLGGGDDVLFAHSQGVSSGGTWDGGAGLNKLSFTLWPPFWHPNRVHRWRMDNRAGQLFRDGETVAAMHGFTYFDRHVRGPFRFIGSDLPETVTSDLDYLEPELPLGRKIRLWPVVLEMGGGDDAVLYLRGGTRSRFDGGAGTDLFSFAAGLNQNYRPAAPIEGALNLATGHLRYSRVDRADIQTSAVGFENVRWWSGADAKIDGTDGPNKIVAQTREPDREIRIHGRAGDDMLRGGWGDDTLIGGGGADVADGREGRDRCSSEVRVRCEH